MRRSLHVGASSLRYRFETGKRSCARKGWGRDEAGLGTGDVTHEATSKCWYRCGEEKPSDAFTQRVDDRYFSMCRSCVSEILSRSNEGPRNKLHHTVTKRTCYLCRRLLPAANFTRRRNGTYFSACKDCNYHVFAQRRRARLRGAEGSYTLEEWQALVAQLDRCPRCGRRWEEITPHPSSGAVITVDHIVPIAKGGSNSIDNV